MGTIVDLAYGAMLIGWSSVYLKKLLKEDSSWTTVILFTTLVAMNRVVASLLFATTENIWLLMGYAGVFAVIARWMFLLTPRIREYINSNLKNREQGGLKNRLRQTIDRDFRNKKLRNMSIQQTKAGVLDVLSAYYTRNGDWMSSTTPTPVGLTKRWCSKRLDEWDVTELVESMQKLDSKYSFLATTSQEIYLFFPSFPKLIALHMEFEKDDTTPNVTARKEELRDEMGSIIDIVFCAEIKRIREIVKSNNSILVKASKVTTEEVITKAVKDLDYYKTLRGIDNE